MKGVQVRTNCKHFYLETFTFNNSNHSVFALLVNPTVSGIFSYLLTLPHWYFCSNFLWCNLSHLSSGLYNT